CEGSSCEDPLWLAIITCRGGRIGKATLTLSVVATWIAKGQMPSANCQSLLYNWFPMFHLALPCTSQGNRIMSRELCVRSSPSMSRESLPSRVFSLSFLLAFVFFLASFASAQDPQSDSSSQSGSASPQPQDKETDPLKRPLTEKQRKENEKRFKQEVSS